MHQGCLGTWEARLIPSRKTGVGAARPQSSWLQAGVGLVQKDERRRTGWYCHANDKEAWRDDRRESERLIVPWKPGNLTRRNPVEGRGRRVAEPLEGNMAGALNPGTMSTQYQRIAERLAANPQLDEPYALIGHVRICGRRRGQPCRRPGPFRRPWPSNSAAN